MKTLPEIVSLVTESKETYVADFVPPGTILANQYQVVSLLKSDSCMLSYLCKELNTEESVVIHMIPDCLTANDIQSKWKQLFDDLTSLDSKNIFTNYQLVTASNQRLLVLAKYPKGNNLVQWRENHDIDLEENRVILKQLLLDAACGLDSLHSRGMVHGCVIPENMLVTGDNSLILIKTGFFSLLGQQMGKRHKTSENRGYLAYQAPELWNGDETGSKSEQYSLAAITYELISGVKPFGWVARADMLKNVVSTQMPDPPLNSTKTEISAIMKALDRDPQRRYSTCKRFVKALTPFRPSPLQVKACLAAVVVFFLLAGGAVLAKAIGQWQENARVARLEAEAKAEEQRRTVEMNKRSNEAGQLQWKAKVALQEVLARKLDEGQTFGEHVRTAQQKYSDGEMAVKEGRRADAYSFFSESLENSGWVRNNAEVRNTIKKTMQRILALRDAEEDYTQKFFPERWQKVTDVCNAAVVAFESGSFMQAEKRFMEADKELSQLAKDVADFMKKEYVEAADKAAMDANWELVQEYGRKMEKLDSELGKSYLEKASIEIQRKTISDELLLAEKSKSMTEWENVILHCNKVLELAGNDKKARELLEEATLATTCNLQAKTRIDDEYVVCSIEINNEEISGTTHEVIKNLPYNKQISIRFVCVRDNTQYEWNGIIDCNWKGVQTLDFTLEKSVDLLLNGMNEARMKMDWHKLLALSTKLLLLDPQSEKAVQMKNLAELELSCNACIIPMINGVEVVAEYTLDSKHNTTGAILRNLTFNKEYIIELHAVQEGTPWEGVCKFKTDWTGVKKITVTLQKTTDILLQKARASLEKKDWQLAYDNAKKVLTLLPEDPEAIRLRDAAETQLTCNLKIRAMLDGHEVEAVIAGSTANTSHIIRRLEWGKKFKYVISYSVGGKIYKGDCEVICDWTGIKEIEIALKDEIKLLSTYANDLVKDKEWNKLLSVARKILEIDSKNELAKHYIELAEINTMKCLQIQPLIGATPVVGDVYQMEISDSTKLTNYIGMTSSLIKKLAPITKQTYYVIYLNPEEDVFYWGELKLNENWTGVKKVIIILTKMNPSIISLGKESIKMKKHTPISWESFSLITKTQFKEITGYDNFLSISYSIKDTGWTFAGKPYYRNVRTINLDMYSIQDFCRLLTQKCINDKIIPPFFQFECIAWSNTGFKVRLTSLLSTTPFLRKNNE
ncbi:MAG: protein kinase [Victivallales bacterium]|nr:protein kinase [Victivallales bacterium]